MNKFYVYAVKTDDPEKRTCVYVDEQVIEKFALHQFEPQHMEYSGVVVEADDPSHAHQVYNTFGEDGEIMWVDEPTFTAKKRQAFDARSKLAGSKLSQLSEVLSQAEQAAARLAIHAYAKGLSMDTLNMNERLSRMADAVRRTSKNSPEVTTQDLYERLKKNYIEKLQEYKYVPKDGSGPDSQITG
ncbi:MAG: hypothetical protein K5880_13855 [Hydrogenophaga sp.]|uniref:hypothetical protein n=1 Tax=Hydrogenophaga sp. TaxID=1904254 RepID=UPI002618C9B6|nr:hypothetical protein [Hydrogenophaga sp.]MCV0439706.1 hypothetical protein [Hydrogenophaga sp.]